MHEDTYEQKPRFGGAYFVVRRLKSLPTGEVDPRL
jgi:hypothetical protein